MCQESGQSVACKEENERRGRDSNRLLFLLPNLAALRRKSQTVLKGNNITLHCNAPDAQIQSRGPDHSAVAAVAQRGTNFDNVTPHVGCLWTSLHFDAADLCATFGRIAGAGFTWDCRCAVGRARDESDLVRLQRTF